MSDDVIGTEVDGYRIQSVLGRGGMGTVYRAEDINLSRTVAIKRINPSQADRESFIHRFRSEAQALARIDSPHIVGVYALRETDIGLLIVMEYVEGGTLKEPLEQQGPMTLEQAVPILEQIMQAFHDAHGAGVIHRDIKPQNIMLTQDGMVKVTDFGIAKLRQPDSGETVTQGGQGGTLKYMSPEQISNISAVDARSDLYSIGMTAYEMLAGDLPFAEADTDFDIMRKVVEGEIPPPDELNPDIPSGLAQWVVGAIRKQQDDRYQSADEMLEALHEADRQVDVTRTQPEWEVDEGSEVDETQTGLPPDAASTRTAVPGDDEAPDKTGGRGETVLDSEGATQPAGPSPSDADLSAADTPEDSGAERAAPSSAETSDADEGLSWTAVAGGLAAALLMGVLGVFAVTQMGSGSGAPASLRLTTSPAGATVLVNGDTAGTTPLAGYSLEAGAVQLQVEREGYRPVDSSFTVEPGEQVALNDLSLTRTDQPETSPSTADAGATSPPTEEADEGRAGEKEPTQTRAADPEPRSATSSSADEPDPATGTVEVSVQPVGTVDVNGESRQDGSVELAGGEHTVTCRHPDGASVQTTVAVAAGETQRLTCYTEATLNVTTDGAWGRILVNGENTGENTSATLSLPPGDHRIEVRRRSIDDFRVDGGVVKIERDGESRTAEFSGTAYELEVAPAFEQVEHAVVFNVVTP